MATRLTRNLRLRVADTLTSDAVANLERIDTLGATFQTTSGSLARIRSVGDIEIESNSPDVGGSGLGGALRLGNSSHSLTQFDAYVGTANLYGTTLRIWRGTSNYVGFSAPSGLVANTTYKLPLSDGSSDYVLTTDGAGNLSWTSKNTASGTVQSVGLSMPSIFSVSGSPVTSSGTLTASLTTQSANLIFAGPSSGGAATPTFRALVSDDLNSIPGRRALSATWAPADGDTKTITHSWGSRKVMVQILDNNDDYERVDVSSITSPNDSQVVVVASAAPDDNWTVLLLEVP